MNVTIVNLAIPMQLVKTHKVVLSVPVMLAILEMAHCAKVKFFPQFVCLFHLKILTLKNQITNVKIGGQKKNSFVEKMKIIFYPFFVKKKKAKKVLIFF
jgi:hypothetical protein